jgi:transcription elongation factor SPT5
LRPDEYSDDDEEEDDNEDESDDDARNQRPNASKKQSAKLSSSEEEEEDDDEEEEEEDEEDNKRKKRKASGGASGGNEKKRPKASSFFDEEAEASEDDDEDDDEPYGTHKDPHDVVKKHYTEEDIRREQMEETALEIIRQQDRRRAQAGGRFGESERSVAEMAQEIEDRHRMQRRTVDRTTYLDQEDAGGAEFTPAVAQQSLVPSVSDPSLWMVSCSTGKEQELVFQIMNKCTAHARQNRPLGISAAIAAQSKGRIYIESFSEPAVMEAIQGVRGLLQYTMRLVPIQDMTTVMTVVSKKKMGKLGGCAGGRNRLVPALPGCFALLCS